MGRGTSGVRRLSRSLGHLHVVAGAAVQGVRAVAGILAPAKRNLVGIGGVTVANAASVIGAGAASVAVISDLMTPDWRVRARDFLKALDGAGEPV